MKWNHALSPLVCALLWASALPAVAAEPVLPGESLVAEFRARFRPTQPTVVLSYSMSYRLLFLQLMKIADARINATQGVWRGMPSGTDIPALLIQLRIDSPDSGKDGERRRVSIHRSIETVLTMPDFETILYTKQADEYVNPLFKSPTLTRYNEVYNFESGSLEYYRRNELNGEVWTNLVGNFDMAKQGKEIPSMLKMMASVYGGEREMLTAASDFRVYVNIDGIITPFVVTTRMEETPFPILGRPVPAMRVDAEPAREAKGRGRPMQLWAVSLEDLAAQFGDEAMKETAADSPAWSMIPLIADYALALGYVRGWLTDMRLEHRDALPPP